MRSNLTGYFRLQEELAAVTCLYVFWVSGNRLMERMKAGLVSQALRVRRD